MFDFQQKRKLRTWFESRTLWVILGIATVFIAVHAYDRYLIALDMKQRHQAIQMELAELSARKAALESEVEYLSGERGIEAEMRRQFDIARAGEQVVIIVEEEVPAVPSQATSTEPDKPWYQFW